MVGLVGLCVYCGKPATQSCKLCGALVCAKHLNHRGVCQRCAGGKNARM